MVASSIWLESDRCLFQDREMDFEGFGFLFMIVRLFGLRIVKYKVVIL